MTGAYRSSGSGLKNMHRIFQTFIDLLSGADDADAFAETMAITATALDLSCFAYLALPQGPRRKPLIISTYPRNWVTHYVHSHYERLDPVIMQALKSPEPFQWGADISNRLIAPAQQEFLNETSEFGIRLVFHSTDPRRARPVAALTFAADQRRPQFENCIDMHARVLQLMAMYFHAHVRRKLTTGRRIDGIVLSPRELECLEWSSRGKSAWEIWKHSRHLTTNRCLPLGQRPRKAPAA
ncbi:autoinducer binding domain-containing protein [Bradyrhizobium sp. 200]|nr:autoinducer binding domain-containing protein [Bradyrhizobium sp. 200]